MAGDFNFGLHVSSRAFIFTWRVYKAVSCLSNVAHSDIFDVRHKVHICLRSTNFIGKRFLLQCLFKEI
jgi:hypothetical protein